MPTPQQLVLMLLDESQGMQYPPARDPLAIIRSVDPNPPRPAAPAEGDPTRIVFSGELGRRPVAALPRLVITSKSAKELEPASFLVGVDARGAVQYVMQQSSSGNETTSPWRSRSATFRARLSPGFEVIRLSGTASRYPA